MNPKKNKPWLLILLIIIFICTTGVFAYQSYQLKQQLSDNQSSKESASPDKVPQQNTIYLGQYQGKESLYVTSSTLNKFHVDGVKKSSPTTGELKQLDGTNLSQFNYQDLTNPRKILTFNPNEELVNLQNFTLDLQNNLLFAMVNSLTPSKDDPDLTQKLYQVNLSDLTSKQIWNYRIDDIIYPKKGAFSILVTAADKYIVLSFGNCYTCGGSGSEGIVVINLETKEDKYLGKVGNIKINLNNKSISYQNLAETFEPCDFGQGCDDGKIIVYKSSGEVLTSTLP